MSHTLWQSRSTNEASQTQAHSRSYSVQATALHCTRYTAWPCGAAFAYAVLHSSFGNDVLGDRQRRCSSRVGAISTLAVCSHLPRHAIVEHQQHMPHASRVDPVAHYPQPTNRYIAALEAINATVRYSLRRENSNGNGMKEWLAYQLIVKMQLVTIL
jgi:hypothetical protein